MICEVCGEPIEDLCCPFCGTVQEQCAPAKKRKKKNLLRANIKDGMPIVDVALKRLDNKISEARHQGLQGLKIIHGYGSSGCGGEIKRETHRYLHRLYNQEEIQTWIPGEEFSASYADTLEVLKLFPFLESDEDFRKANKGISIALF